MAVALALSLSIVKGSVKISSLLSKSLRATSMEKNNEESLHIVMFPWLAMGHLIPFLQFSKILAQKGHKISFISTPKNLMRLPKIPSHLSPLITLVSLPLPKVEGLPELAESSMDIPHHKAQILKIAFDLLESPLVTFLETTTKPDWIVFDYAAHWVPSLASRLGISSAYFSLFTAATKAFLGPPSMVLSGQDKRSTAEDFCRVPEWVPFESNLAFRSHEMIKRVEGDVGNKSGTSDSIRFAASVDGCDLVLFRTMVEFEPEWFNLVCDMYQKHVLAIGVLPPVLSEKDESKDYENLNFVKKWLDKQNPDSVVFVALGSEATLSQVELSELALGLERSGLPFFWVIRKSATESTQDESQTLPEGFVERVKGRGMVYFGWVPQVRILSHSSVGGFLTHCGWNSAIEGLSLGRVLIFFPVMNEQGLNTRLLSGKRLGVEISRNDRDGSFTSDSVSEAVKLAMESEQVRANAREMKGLFGNMDKNDQYIDACTNHLLKFRKP